MHRFSRILAVLTLAGVALAGAIGASGGKVLCISEGHVALEADHRHGEALAQLLYERHAGCTDWSIDSQRADQLVSFDNTHHIADATIAPTATLFADSGAIASYHEPPWRSPPVVGFVVLLT